MRTYTKILVTTLPLVFFFLITTGGISYYFSRNALTDLAEEWLSNRVSEAIIIAEKHEDILHKYGLEGIPASIVKAKLNAAKEISAVKIRKTGYFMGIDTQGSILFHPNKNYMGTDVSSENWFKHLKKKNGRLFLTLQNEKTLAIYDFFPKWDWFVLAVSPEKEVYGLADQMKPYLLSLGIGAAIIVSLALMALTRHMMKPLQSLIEGTDRIGKGDLDTQIPINSHDEFSHLAKEFNRMTVNLKETQSALQYSEEYFRSLIENATDLITITDSEGIFIYASPSIKRILGYDPNDLIGKNGFDYIHPDERNLMFEQFKKKIQFETPVQIAEFRFKHLDGYWCILESISTNLLAHPAVKGFVINSRDISKQKRVQEALKKSHQELEQRVDERTKELLLLNQTLSQEIQARRIKEAELKKAHQAKTEFLANISHEIRTPLNSVMGFSEILSTMIKGKQENDYINAIQIAGKNLLCLINDILDLSRVEAGKLELNKVVVNIPILFDEIYQLYKTRIEEKSIVFIKDIDDSLPTHLIMDDIRLRQILVNLIDNAVKFTNHGHITLKVQQINSHNDNHDLKGTSNQTATSKIDLAVSIEDTGMGIPQENLTIIFDSFQQASSQISRKFGGTGLGLSICKHLVALMEGHIKVESIVDKGTVFRLVLPGIEISQSHPETEKNTTLDYKTIQFSGKTILMADNSSGRPAVFLSDRTLKKYCLENNTLKEQINSRIFQLIPEFTEGIKIADVQILIENMTHIGESFHIPEFRQFGLELSQNAQSFDIKKLERRLGQLYKTLKTIV